MESILIISSNGKSIDSVRELIGSACPAPADCALCANEAREKLSEKEYDLILINAPLPDEQAELLAAETAENTASGVLLLVDNSREQETEERLLPYGVLVLGKPLSRKLLLKTLRLLEGARLRLLGVKQENIRLHKKIDDSRIINRAKAILTEYLNMTEPQAHKYLERQAMELRVPKVEIAKRLLITYEN